MTLSVMIHGCPNITLNEESIFLTWSFMVMTVGPAFMFNVIILKLSHLKLSKAETEIASLDLLVSLTS